LLMRPKKEFIVVVGALATVHPLLQGGIVRLDELARGGAPPWRGSSRDAAIGAQTSMGNGFCHAHCLRMQATCGVGPAGAEFLGRVKLAHKRRSGCSVMVKQGCGTLSIGISR